MVMKEIMVFDVTRNILENIKVEKMEESFVNL